MKWATLAGCVASLVGMRAHANGGPIAADDTPGGELAPPPNFEIRLLREELSIVVDELGRSYDVDARYQLENPGSAAAVDFGVPIHPYAQESGYRGTDEPIPAAAGKSIKIVVAGREYGCAKILSEHVGSGSRSSEERALAWCVTRIELPAGSVELRLQYSADLFYSDSDSNKSPFHGFGERRLRYALFPAGNWKGNLEQLQISVELGDLARFAAPGQPRGAKRNGTKLVWSLTDVDLRKSRWLDIGIDAVKYLTHREVGSAGSASEVKVSSELKSQSGNEYGPQNLVDGDPATAWCEGVNGDGVGQWIEITLKNQSCSPVGFAVVPGYAKSQTAYRANGRVSRLSVQPCGGGEAERTDVPVEARFDESGQFLYWLGAVKDWTKLAGPPYEFCWRLTIEKVERGDKYRDTCISTLVPVISCG